ncbi:hypothetical protein lerEdw1_001509 [Lerista edwardsae]|nr:hypothetical protein lerEdw1_001509 [Lerista edwardsae]
MADTTLEIVEQPTVSEASEEPAGEEPIKPDQINGVMVLTLLDKIIGAVDQIQLTQSQLEERQQEMDGVVASIQGELAKLTKAHTTTSNTVNKMLEKVRKVSVNVKTVRQNLEKQAGQIKKLESNEAELLKRRNFKVMIYQLLLCTGCQATLVSIPSTALELGVRVHSKVALVKEKLNYSFSRHLLSPINCQVYDTHFHPTESEDLCKAVPASCLPLTRPTVTLPDNLKAPLSSMGENIQPLEPNKLKIYNPLNRSPQVDVIPSCVHQEAHFNFLVFLPGKFILPLYLHEIPDEVKLPTKLSISKSLKEMEKEGEGEEVVADEENPDEHHIQLSSDEEVEVEEIIEESRAERIKRSGMRKVDDFKKAFSKEKMEKTKLKTKENLEKTKLKTKENLEKTKQNLEKTRHNLEKRMNKLGTKIVTTERREKMKTSREKLRKSFTPDHTVYARSKTAVYKVPPFTFHVKKIREGEVEVKATEMVEVGGDETDNADLLRGESPEMSTLLQITEEADTVLADKSDSE